MLVFNSNTFVVKYDNEKEQLQLTCSNQLQSNEFKAGLKNALAYAEKLDIKCWLFDLRQIACLNDEEITCIFDYFIPQVMTNLGTDNFVAVLLCDKCYQKLVSEVGSTGMKSYNSFIKMNAFCELSEATAWLNLQKSTLLV